MLNLFKPDSRKLKDVYKKIRSKNQYEEENTISDKIIERGKNICALIGFSTSVIGFGSIIIPLLAPLFIIVLGLVDMIFCTKIEVEMIYLLAYHYRYEPDNPILGPLKDYILSGTEPEGEALMTVAKLDATALQETRKKKGVMSS
jgi:hypothetical protein